MENQLRTLQVDYEDKSYELSARLQPASDDLIVFLHGWGCSKESFDSAFSSNALEGYSICAVDLLGFGDSDQPTDFSYDLSDQANIVALAINSLEAEKVHLVGHSMGGGIGVLAAPLLKEKLATFISADSNLAPNGGGLDARIVSKQPLWLFQSLTLPAIRAFAGLRPDRCLKVWAQWCRKAGAVGLYRSIQSLGEWSDSGELLPRFQALPDKAYIYAENGRRKKDVVPELDASVTYEISGSGHMLMTDNPRDFYATVARIIQAA